MNKVILYIAVSQDGFIADKNGGVGWLPHPKDDEDLAIVGYTKLMERIDTILIGSKSYKQIIGFGDWAWTDKHTTVFSAQILESSLPCISLTQDSPRQFMDKMKDGTSRKDIWLLGGALLAQSFAREGLIDEIQITIIPKMLGEGIPLNISFDGFDLISEKPLMDGMIGRVYFKKEGD